MYPQMVIPTKLLLYLRSLIKKKPHVVIVYANGKCECQDCLGYSSAFVCAHTVASSVKVGRLDAFLKWLVTTKRKTGGINYSKAITHGMLAGGGKKPNQAPRKRSKVGHPTRDPSQYYLGLQHKHHQTHSTNKRRHSNQP